jgi:hypothetical protein
VERRRAHPEVAAPEVRGEAAVQRPDVGVLELAHRGEALQGGGRLDARQEQEHAGRRSSGLRSRLARATATGSAPYAAIRSVSATPCSSVTSSPSPGGISSSTPTGRRSSDERSGLAPTSARMRDAVALDDPDSVSPRPGCGDGSRAAARGPARRDRPTPPERHAQHVAGPDQVPLRPLASSSPRRDAVALGDRADASPGGPRPPRTPAPAAPTRHPRRSPGTDEAPRATGGRHGRGIPEPA